MVLEIINSVFKKGEENRILDLQLAGCAEWKPRDMKGRLGKIHV